MDYKWFKNACIIIQDTILHLEPEHITKNQLKSLCQCINILKNPEFSMKDFNKIDDILAGNDLDWISEIE